MQARPFDLGDGLQLRAASRDDADALIALVRHNVAHLGRYLPPVAEILTAEAAAAHFDLADRQIADGKLIDWHVFQDGVLCGEIRLNYIEETNRKSAVAYFLDQRYQGRGIISRALARVLEHAFVELAFNRIELRCIVTNAPSRRVAERAGFVLEGRLRQAEWLDGRFQDDFVFSLLASEYRQPDASKRRLFMSVERRPA